MGLLTTGRCRGKESPSRETTEGSGEGFEDAPVSEEIRDNFDSSPCIVPVGEGRTMVAVLEELQDLVLGAPRLVLGDDKSK